jgi:UDP-glucose:(heptosyl)LPS alpha-1,3-glucosyltransferase
LMDKTAFQRGGIKTHKLVPMNIGMTLKWDIFNKVVSNWLALKHFDLIWGHGDLLAQDILSLHNCVHRTFEAVHNVSVGKEVGPLYFHRRLLEKQSFRRLIANSELMKNDLVRRFRIPPEKITVIYPGYDPARFSAETRAKRRESARRSLGLSDFFCIGTVNSGDFKKRGVDRFLKILGELSPSFKAKSAGLVVGKDRHIEPYQRDSNTVGLKGGVRFLSPTSEIEDYYSAMDVMIYPAFFEEFGMGVQEAIMCGVPVLSTSQVGASELFKGTARSMVFEEFNASLFAASVEALLSSSDLKNRVLEDARQLMRGNTWDSYYNQLSACL